MRVVHSIHGDHTRMGAPVDGGVGVVMGTGSRRVLNALRGGHTCVRQFYGPRRLILTLGIRAPSGTVATIIANTRVVLPLRNLVGVRRRITHLRGR